MKFILVKLQPHKGDNLDERIVTILCKRVYGATQDEWLSAAKVYSERKCPIKRVCFAAMNN